MRFSDFKKPIEFSQSVHEFMKMLSEGISAAKAIKQQKNNKKNLIQFEYFKDETERMQRKYKFPATFRQAQIHAKAVKFGFVPPQIEISASGQNMLKVCPCCMQPISTQEIPLNYATTTVPEMPSKKSPNFNNWQPFKLQASIAMFFLFIKMVIIYLTIIFFVYSIYSMSNSMDSALCLKYKCKNDSFLHMFSKPSSSQSQKKLSQAIQDLLCLLTVVLSIGFFFIYRRFQLKLYDRIDSQVNSQDDYTIFVENIPIYDFPPGFDITTMPKDKVLSFNYETKLKKIFEDQINQWIVEIQKKKDKNMTLKKLQSNAVNHILHRRKLTFSQWRKQAIKVQSISLCYDLGDLNKIQQKRQELIDKVNKLGQLVQKHLKKYYEKQLKIQQFNKVNINKYKIEKKRKQWQKTKKKAFKLTNNYQAIKSKIDQLNNRLIALNSIELSMNYDFAHNRTPIFNLTHFVGKALVSFEYKHYREYIVRKYQNGWDDFKYPGTDVGLKISRAPHPTDINWENMNVSREDRQNRIMTSFLIMFMGLIFSGFILVLLNSGKGDIINFGKNRKFLNDMLNYILSILGSTFISYLNLYVSVYSEKLTQYESHHIMANQYASMIAKTLLIQFLNTAFIFWLIHFILNSSLTGSQGLIVQISTLIIINSVKTIGLKVLEHKCWKVILNRKYHDDEDYSKFTFQIELNKSFEFPVFNITDRYADYLLELYTILLYCYLMPIGALAGIVNFALQYWVDKVILFKFSSMYNYPGVQLSRLVLKFFEASLILFVFGCFTFSWKLSGNFPILNMVSLVISIIYFAFTVMMSDKTERWLFGEGKIEQESYSSVYRVLFQQTYWTQNPATSFICEKNLNNKKQIVEDTRPKVEFADPKTDWAEIAQFGLAHKRQSEVGESEESEYEEVDEYDINSHYYKRQPIIPKNYPDVEREEKIENQQHMDVSDDGLLQKDDNEGKQIDGQTQNNNNRYEGYQINQIPAWQNSNYYKNLIQQNQQQTNLRDSIRSQRSQKSQRSHNSQRSQISERSKNSQKSHFSKKPLQPDYKPQQKFVTMQSQQSEDAQPMNVSKRSSHSQSSIFQQKTPSQQFVQQEINKIIGNDIVKRCEFTIDQYYEKEDDSEESEEAEFFEPPKFHQVNSMVEIHEPEIRQ